MNKKLLKMIGMIVLSIMCFTTCDKNSTEPEKNDKHPSQLVGDWKSTTQTMDVIVTSNTEQKVPNFFAQANGSIAITGQQQANLKYMITGREDDGTLVVIAATMKDLFEYNENDFPIHFLMYRMAATPTVMLQAMLSETEVVQYSGAATNINYDHSNFSLSANNVTLFTTDSSDSVTVNGTLAAVAVNVPANTATTVFSLDDATALESIINFSADGKFTRTSTYDWGTENSTGTWEVSDGDNLKIVETYVDQHNETTTDTINGTFSISESGILTIEFHLNVCEVFHNAGSSETDCIREFEQDFFFENGSLTAVTVLGSYTLSKL